MEDFTALMTYIIVVSKTIFVGPIALASLVLPLATVRQANIVVMKHVP
jgi:hypothetical protein